MVAPLQDWGLIDKSNETELRNDIPRIFRGKEQFGLLNSTLDTILDIKKVAIQNQVEVPGLANLIDKYMQAIAYGTQLKEQSFWKGIRSLRDWHGTKDAFKHHCKTVCTLAHQTSFLVHTKDARTDKSETNPEGSIRRRRSLDGLVQAEPQPHNSFDDPPMRSTPPDAGLLAAQSLSINANTLQEEMIRHIAETSAAKTLEQFILHGRLSGWIPQTINNFSGCLVRPGRGTGYTVNNGGENNKGAAMNKFPSPTEVRGNGTDDIDDTSDNDLPDKVTLDLLGHYDVSSVDSDED
ncbi:hypothetical protein CY34DRAFT_806282 [Suillus luteus UH-Slu-Lm8-n1]|uniref:Uncharacterized protein n=1 Tax=Suillus luteus UH-Slu-Lm8-n1 TaxID=930992 RepID=A0A0C9ZTK1_9AGAM|nr:hypothetical protein CY34DRAFT_806282 [Suillus luteus UH-Slu-Lm8-n1]